MPDLIGEIPTPFLDAPDVRVSVTVGAAKPDRDRLAYINQLGGRPPAPDLIERYGFQQVIGMNAEELGALIPLLVEAHRVLTERP